MARVIPHFFDKIGVDEAGRGALAGPVVAAAVLLPISFPLTLLKDSKQLSAKKRGEIATLLRQSDALIGVGILNHLRVDQLNVLQATMVAMARSIMQVIEMRRSKGLASACDIWVDGNRVPKLEGLSCRSLVKGDQLEACISAASIIAKVTRDRIMTDLDTCFKGYHFSVHKGYGTKAHYRAISQLGISTVHRRSFNLDPKGSQL